ncbi:uncharacterized protein MELLADRAFT_63845 [Melampsora larici-populina 98AG31]|uniref:Secreted protein n=1 Tax=Melampsora larici-populina (strain 98AG31 / pathotype 3-4-7) TaxID=747676 RepID=F4RPC6_MELLP|nr:uncharacterized protein MELLADRAFT_63845 [Melampsora larici-populina 98AG31]EGG05792.1 hypothetical protein MELLADRAFT_63845 [Melampsora larici-populina 98AG31]
MVWFLMIGFLHLLAFQTDCFPTKLTASSGWPTTHMENCRPNEIDQTPTLTPSTEDLSHQFSNTPSSSTIVDILSERPQIHIDLNTEPEWTEELLSDKDKDVSASRKRKNIFEKKSKSSSSSRKSNAISDFSSKQNKLQIDLNSFPPEITEEVISENSPQRTPSSAVVILPSRENQWSEASTSNVDRLYTNSPENQCMIQGIDPMNEDSSPKNVASITPLPNISARKEQEKPNLERFNSNNSLFTESERCSTSNSKHKDSQWTTQSLSQDTHSGTPKSLPPPQNLHGPHTEFSDVVVSNTNMKVSPSSHSQRKVSRAHPSDIYTDVAYFHLDNSPILAQINSWFHDFKTEMYHKNKSSKEVQLHIDYLIKRTQEGLTIGFLGCLYIFEHQKAHWKDLSALFEDGWEFLKSLFGQWKEINFEDLEKMNFNDSFDSSYWSTNPWKNAKYFLDMDVRQKIPMSMYIDLHELWSRRGSNPMEMKDIQAMHRDFFKVVKEMDPEILQNKFHKLACVNSQEFKSYLQGINTDDTQAAAIKDKPKVIRLSDTLKITGRKHASERLSTEIHVYFKNMHSEVTDAYYTHLVGSLYADGMKASSTHAQGTIQSDEQLLKDCKKAINQAHSQVTFGFLGSLFKIYQHMLNGTEMEEVFQNGWKFLVGQFNTWSKDIVKILQINKQQNFLQIRPIRTNSMRNSLDIFQYLVTHQTPYVPVNCVHALLNWWISDLAHQEEKMGRKMNFRIPDLIKQTLGSALKNPRRMFQKRYAM